jgi:hypothetical protein
MAKRYRCLNLKCADKTGIPGHEFVSDKPVCDRCGTDQNHPRFGRYIHTLKVIHFDPPSHIDGEGMGFLACDPKRALLNARATADPTVVNCPLCLDTDAWRTANKQRGVLEEDDFSVRINLPNGAVAKSESTVSNP